MISCSPGKRKIIRISLSRCPLICNVTGVLFQNPLPEDGKPDSAIFHAICACLSEGKKSSLYLLYCSFRTNGAESVFLLSMTALCSQKDNNLHTARSARSEPPGKWYPRHTEPRFAPEHACRPEHCVPSFLFMPVRDAGTVLRPPVGGCKYIAAGSA